MNNKRNTILLFVFLLVYIGIHLYLSQYTNPIADDFSYSMKCKNSTLFHEWIGDYLTWNGRYTSNIIVFLNPLAFHSFLGYKIIPLILFLFLFISIYGLLKNVLKTSLNTFQIINTSLILLALYLHQMPTIAEGFYWYTGAVTYTLGSILFIQYLSLFYSYSQKEYLVSRHVHFFILALISIITAGFNEVIMLEMLFMSILLSYLFFKRKHPLIIDSLYLLIVALIGFATVYFAPGNSIRESYFNNKHHIFFSIGYSFLQTGRFILKWTASIPLIIISIIYYEWNIKLSEKLKLFSHSFYLTIPESIIILLSVVFICIFPTYWSTGMLGQYRTVNVAYFLFLFMWFINLTVCFNAYKTHAKKYLTINKTPKILLYIVFICATMFTKNGQTVLNDLISGKAQNYNTQMIKRYTIIKKAIDENSDTIYFDSIKNPPSSLFVLDITNDPHHWINFTYATYFSAENKKIIPRKSN